MEIVAEALTVVVVLTIVYFVIGRSLRSKEFWVMAPTFVLVVSLVKQIQIQNGLLLGIGLDGVLSGTISGLYLVYLSRVVGLDMSNEPIRLFQKRKDTPPPPEQVGNGEIQTV